MKINRYFLFLRKYVYSSHLYLSFYTTWTPILCIPKSHPVYDISDYFLNKFRLPIYVDNNNTVNKDICTKKFPIYHSLSPGMIMVCCKHKICYGDQILRSKEFTIAIFHLLLTHFKVQPRIIIYYNACHLHRTCTNR